MATGREGESEREGVGGWWQYLPEPKPAPFEMEMTHFPGENCISKLKYSNAQHSKVGFTFFWLYNVVD
jgi:hypothetical protein